MISPLTLPPLMMVSARSWSSSASESGTAFGYPTLPNLLTSTVALTGTLAAASPGVARECSVQLLANRSIHDWLFNVLRLGSNAFRPAGRSCRARLGVLAFEYHWCSFEREH
jgi:hypothetical protein